MVNVPAVLSTYLHGYGLFRKSSGFQPAEQEVVFLAISQTIPVSGMTLTMLNDTHELHSLALTRALAVAVAVATIMDQPSTLVDPVALVW